MDGIRVYEVEAERIRRAHGQLLARGVPHPPGACAFLDAEGACRIYPDRPYVCRTQGLPLRWLEERCLEERCLEENEQEQIVERRDICPLNVAEAPLSDLDEADCWLLGPTEQRLAALQAERDGGALRRVALRSLFRRQE